jgi:hypothetical protein
MATSSDRIVRHAVAAEIDRLHASNEHLIVSAAGLHNAAEKISIVNPSLLGVGYSFFDGTAIELLRNCRAFEVQPLAVHVIIRSIVRLALANEIGNVAFCADRFKPLWLQAAACSQELSEGQIASRPK